MANRIDELENKRELTEQEQTEYSNLKESEEVIRTAVKDLIDEFNLMGKEDFVADVIFDQLLRSHRTLQQKFWHGISSILNRLSKTEYSWAWLKIQVMDYYRLTILKN